MCRWLFRSAFHYDEDRAEAVMALLWLSAALSAVVDNIPNVAAMSPVVGASANVVVLGIAERAGHRISFWQFTRYGLVVAAITIAISMPYLWLRYFVLNDWPQRGNRPPVGAWLAASALGSLLGSLSSPDENSIELWRWAPSSLSGGR